MKTTYSKLALAKLALAGVVAVALAATSGAYAANCPQVTVTDNKGVAAGKYPQQYDLAEFQKLANCTLSFSENPDIGKLNGRIIGNPPLPPLAERLPEEPLVVAPYDAIGTYGGVLDALSNATEAGTADLLSIRHVNFVRYADDLTTIVPNVAKDWTWNDDYTELTFFLRKGHRWSDGAPFTAHDVKFWYDDLNMDTNVIEKPKGFLLVGGKRMEVKVIDDHTVKFILPAPKPGLLSHFATSYSQGFQPQHFLGQFHPRHNPDADKLAQAAGFKNGYEVIAFYYGNSDWTDTPSPLLRDPSKIEKLPAAVVPTLESHITIADTTEGRHYVANPYFFMVDTAGNQFPYIPEQDEIYINDNEVRILKLVNAEVDYKSQSVQLPSAPLLLENQAKGDYTVHLKPTIAMPVFSFNVTSQDLEKRKIFGDLRFRQAMSVAMNRSEINEVAFFGLGTPGQWVAFSPPPSFITDEWKQHYAQHDAELAAKLLDDIGLKDQDGDGKRDLPSGERFTLNLQYATQGIAGNVVELVAQHWANVGIDTTFKEVTPDEYRAAQSANELDVMIWAKGMPIAIILGNDQMFVPPFDDYFTHRTGMLWGEYIETDGAKGVKPPAYVYQMIKDIAAFQSTPAGTPQSDAIGKRLIKNMVGNLLFLGTVQAPAPIYHRNALKNFIEFKTWSYEYYRTFPYRPQQWFFQEG
ncbi:MAG: ABC transporter substrate-binding protein [Gammaproteobacteria bacterium]|nr:ABC transporter substrate-binding protein [Gammaproteobacteria bacterium]